MSRARVIINPNSGDEGGEDLADQIESSLSSCFDEVEICVSKDAEDVEKLAREAREQGIDALFTVGGDGTVGTAVRGMLDGAEEGAELPALGILPGGTGNGLARTLGYPRDIPGTLEAIDCSRTVPLDLGFANGVPFTYTLTGGSLPEGIREVSSEDKSRFGFAAYVASELKRIGGDESHRMRITVDGEAIEEDINSFIGFSANVMVNQFSAAEDTETDEGLIHLFALKDASLPALVSMIPNILARTVDESEHILFLHGKSIKLECLDGELTCGMDGDDGPALPVELTVAPGLLRTFPVKEDARS
ncbi:MAG: diacylglycerol kinase family lipid kinase [Coriobacteriaceae bacterium]|nr:diacylglycerol kinase family lipid kinase [Coriobacteriaceae bacterium]